MADSDDTPRWRREAEKILHRAADTLDDAADAARRRIRRLQDRARTVHIHPYTGFASDRSLVLEARVLGGEAPDDPADNASLWANVLDTYRRLASREIAGARVALEVAGESHEAVSDDEGYLRFQVDLDAPLVGPWHEGTLYLLGLEEGRIDADAERTATWRVRVPTAPARLGIISDVDDTVLHTGATDRLNMARRTIFGNAKTRKPLVGAAALYRALVDGQGGECNPLFYVSSSPWNLYDLLDDFLRLNELPAGPLLLQDFGVDDTRFISDSSHGHKLTNALRVIDTFPDLSFVLIGDSGQEDASLYLQAIAQRPGRIRAAYIRDIDPDQDSEHDRKVDAIIAMCAEHGVPMVRVADSTVVAQHAAALGLIPNQIVASVAASTRKDRTRPG